MVHMLTYRLAKVSSRLANGVKAGIQGFKENNSNGDSEEDHIGTDQERPKKKAASYQPTYDDKGNRIPSLVRKAYEFDRDKLAKSLDIYPYFKDIVWISDDLTSLKLKEFDRDILVFGSNDYLSSAKRQESIQASIEATYAFGTGLGGSRIMRTTSIHSKLEEELTEFVGTDDALLYPAGYLANLGFECLFSKDEREGHIIFDRSIHNSLLAGAILSRAKLHRYNHGDIGQLEEILDKIGTDPHKMIVVDGVYSMEGDIENLPALYELAEEHNCVLFVDDAHGIGVIGRKLNNPNHLNDGSGTARHFGLNPNVPKMLTSFTFSKSLGGLGGVILGTERNINYLRNNSNSQIFAASSPAGLVAAAYSNLQLLRKEPERIKKLWDNSVRMRKGLKSVGFEIGGHNDIPILPLYVRDQVDTLYFAKFLLQEGIYVNAIVQPGVRPKSELLRISIMDSHTCQQIDYAIEIIEKVGKKLGVI